MLPDPTERPCVSADEAFAELGIDRTTGYRAIKEGTFPIPVIRVGRLIRIPTATLRQLLATGLAPVSAGYDSDPAADPVEGEPTATRPDRAHRAALRVERLETTEAR